MRRSVLVAIVLAAAALGQPAAAQVADDNMGMTETQERRQLESNNTPWDLFGLLGLLGLLGLRRRKQEEGYVRDPIEPTTRI